MMKPSEYAQRYLPLQVAGPTDSYPINISRYHLGDPTAGANQLQGAVIDHFNAHSKDSKYRLKLTVNGSDTIEFANRHDIGPYMARAFYGKGSPEDCQIVLQLALLVGRIKTAASLQTWADNNLGLDCNGFVGNYLNHAVQGYDWRTRPKATEVDPSSKIDAYFSRWTTGAITDLSTIQSGIKHLIVRVEDNGKVIPQYSGGKVGHVAITEPNESMVQSVINDDKGDLDADAKKLGMDGKFALRTVESGGPITGVQKNWMVFMRPTRVKGVFEVRRDHIHMVDTVSIGQLRLQPL